MSEQVNKTEKKQYNFFVRTFIPNKNDNIVTIITKITVFICIIVFAICLYKVLPELIAQEKDKKMNEDIKNKIELNASGTFSIDKEKIDSIKQEVPEILDKFIDLYAENDELIGWIKVGHRIDYPVMMSKNENDFYLHHNFNKDYTESGSIFCDNHIVPCTDASNLIIYGHYFIGSDEYFSTLPYYDPNSMRSQEAFLEYYKQYPTLRFDTLYEEGTYKIFAGMYININRVDGYAYPYHTKRTFENEYQFMDFMGNIMDRSMFYTDVDVEYGDKILTLSTCYWHPLGRDYDTRFVLFARKVREGESPEVDVDKVTINPSPLYFDTYYNISGLKWEGRKWDLSLVKDFDKYTDIIDSQDNVELSVMPEKTETDKKEP